MLKVFVYGTLKPSECNYQHYCANRISHQTRAYTWGKLFHLPLGYPAMILGNEQVQGFLLTFISEDAIARLDELEDYQADREPTKNLYYRQKVPVYDLSGQFLDEAWAYFMTPEKLEQISFVLVSSGWWSSLEQVNQGH